MSNSRPSSQQVIIDSAELAAIIVEGGYVHDRIHDAGACTFRHSFATHLLEANYDIKTVQELLGHNCGVQMIEQMPSRAPRKAVATWEHIINDASIVTRENIARCCVACNSSKGTKKLSEWIQSGYCEKRGISKDTVAEVVKEALHVHA